MNLLVFSAAHTQAEEGISPEHPKTREHFDVPFVRDMLSICYLQHQPGAMAQHRLNKWPLSVPMQDVVSVPGEMGRYKNRPSLVSQRLAVRG